MLTEIEWWGGLLIVWGAVACWSICHFNGEDGSTLFRRVVLAAFSLCGLAFALYFYELAQPAARYVFLAFSAAAGVTALVFLVLYWRIETADEQGTETDAGALNEGEQDEEEEATWLELSLAHLFLLSPVVLALSLVGFKSWTVVQLV